MSAPSPTYDEVLTKSPTHNNSTAPVDYALGKQRHRSRRRNSADGFAGAGFDHKGTLGGGFLATLPDGKRF